MTDPLLYVMVSDIWILPPFFFSNLALVGRKHLLQWKENKVLGKRGERKVLGCSAACKKAENDEIYFKSDSKMVKK